MKTVLSSVASELFGVFARLSDQNNYYMFIIAVYSHSGADRPVTIDDDVVVDV